MIVYLCIAECPSFYFVLFISLLFYFRSETFPKKQFIGTVTKERNRSPTLSIGPFQFFFLSFRIFTKIAFLTVKTLKYLFFIEIGNQFVQFLRNQKSLGSSNLIFIFKNESKENYCLKVKFKHNKSKSKNKKSNKKVK